MTIDTLPSTELLLLDPSLVEAAVSMGLMEETELVPGPESPEVEPAGLEQAPPSQALAAITAQTRNLDNSLILLPWGGSIDAYGNARGDRRFFAGLALDASATTPGMAYSPTARVSVDVRRDLLVGRRSERPHEGMQQQLR